MQNTGTENVTNVSMTDMVPANTTYVAGSTTLNGASVADDANGSPLAGGSDLGDLPNDGPIATVDFDVAVYPDLPDGTIISNQAFVSAVDQGWPTCRPTTRAPISRTIRRGMLLATTP